MVTVGVSEYFWWKSMVRAGGVISSKSGSPPTRPRWPLHLPRTPTPNKVMSQNYRCEICEMTAKCLRNAAKWCEVDGVKAAKPCEMAAKRCETRREMAQRVM